MRLEISQTFLLAASVLFHTAENSDEVLSAFYQRSFCTFIKTCTLHNTWQHARKQSDEEINVTSIPA